MVPVVWRHACNTPPVEGRKSHIEGTQGVSEARAAGQTTGTSTHRDPPAQTNCLSRWIPVYWCPLSGGTRATRRRLREGSPPKELKASEEPEQHARQRAPVYTGIHRLKQFVGAGGSRCILVPAVWPAAELQLAWAYLFGLACYYY